MISLSNFPIVDYVKAAIIGFFASFLMFVATAPAINFDIAPFNIPPPAAVAYMLGIGFGPIPWIMHFIYGTFWSCVFVFIWGREGSTFKGIALGFGLWLLLMVVYSPLVGWGFFGFGDAHLLPVNHPLYLREGADFALLSLVIHLVYGGLVGWLNPLWEQVETL